jgi:hypothetical protein
MANPKHCSVCGTFLPTRLHGACLKCIKTDKKGKLPPGLAQLKKDFDEGKFLGKPKSSIRGILNAVQTLLYDDDVYALNWDPRGNLQKVLDTSMDRPYLSQETLEEIFEIVEGEENA